MTKRAPGLLEMTAPLIVSFWMRVLFTFVDTYYASRLPNSDAAVAAIGLSFPFELIMIAVWVGLSTGLTSNFSRAMGAHQETKLRQYLSKTWTLVLVCIPVFCLIGAGCWVFAGRLSPGPEVAHEFAIYGSVLVAGSGFTLFWSVIPDSIVKAHGDTKATMWAGIWSNVINVALNTIFTFWFHWGIFGIAFSTVVGRFGGLVYALRKAARHEAERKARHEPEVPGEDPSPYRSLFALALPSAMAYLLMASETGVVNWLLKTTEHGKEALAAYAIYYRVFQFIVTPAIAASVAMLPFAGRRFGERDVAGVTSGLKQAHLAGAIYVVITAPIVWLTAPPLAHHLTTSPVTVSYLVPALRLIPLIALVAMPFFLCRPVFEGMGRGRPGLAMSLLRYLLLAAPAAWAGRTLAPGLGLSPVMGLVVGLGAATAVSSIIFLSWTRRALVHARETLQNA
ncbi:MAG TPA: MATE family efflux transporter [Candidatus Polarisedimenticolaceae bacterium]|nr:MATE family efflux transporter [Candidatus Polarisedimenticolaceae bacterium]